MNPYANWHISDTDQKLYAIFMPRYVERVSKIAESNQKLVHYTSAATALSILKNKEIWMRNTRCMNDFLEVKYGIELFICFCQQPEFQVLKKAWGKKAGVFEEAFFSAVEAFDEWSNSTYICCFSEHEAEEDQLGRLSMWRGYGTDCGVAMVLRPDSFMVQNNDFQIYTTPVEYLTKKEFKTYLLEMENNRKGFSIPANLDHLIIGPTPYPAVIAKALAEELAKCGVTDPLKKITVSAIPYRAHV